MFFKKRKRVNIKDRRIIVMDESLKFFRNKNKEKIKVPKSNYKKEYKKTFVVIQDIEQVNKKHLEIYLKKIGTTIFYSQIDKYCRNILSLDLDGLIEKYNTDELKELKDLCSIITISTDILDRKAYKEAIVLRLRYRKYINHIRELKKEN